jgi:hypothetical protein
MRSISFTHGCAMLHGMLFTTVVEQARAHCHVAPTLGQRQNEPPPLSQVSAGVEQAT